MPTTYCRHIRTNGSRCQSSALRDKAFCYFHIGINARHRALHAPRPANDGPALPEAPFQLAFPALEDRESIQVSISMLLSALGGGHVEPRRASAMLYALQVASTNARHLDLEPRYGVKSVVPGEDGTDIAPDVDPAEVVARREFEKHYKDYELDEDDEGYEEQEDEEEDEQEDEEDDEQEDEEEDEQEEDEDADEEEGHSHADTDADFQELAALSRLLTR